MDTQNQPHVIKRITDSPDLVDIMLSVEDYLDQNDLYAFKNWFKGELVAGPYVQPYWIKVTFKWPYKLMPDPSGAARLLKQGTKIRYKKASEMVPIPVKTPSDYQPGTHKPKIEKQSVWLVELLIPRRFVENIKDEVIDLYDDQLKDAETTEDANAEGTTEENATLGNNT